MEERWRKGGGEVEESWTRECRREWMRGRFGGESEGEVDDLLPAGVALQPACADLGPLGVEGDGEVSLGAVLRLVEARGDAAVGDRHRVVVVRPVREIAPGGGGGEGGGGGGGGGGEELVVEGEVTHLATVIPASRRARRVSGCAELGPIVHTIPESLGCRRCRRCSKCRWR